MICDTLENIELYKNVHPTLYRGLQLVRDTDFSKLEKGKYVVEGDDLFYLVQEYNTKVANLTPEIHREYIDIQFVAEGSELMGYAPLEADAEELPGSHGDVYFVKSHLNTIALNGKTFFVAFPQDVHAPGISPDGVSRPVRKVVVKVKI